MATSPAIIEPLRGYPKLLELYCFGCMGPIAVSPRSDVLVIVERLHVCGPRLHKELPAPASKQ
jgi:hypothetical protein